MDKKIFDANAILNQKKLDQEIEDIKSDATFSLRDPKDSLEVLQKLQGGIAAVQQKIKDGLAQTHDHEIAANRLAILKLTGDVVDYVNNELSPDQKQMITNPTGDGTTQPANVVDTQFSQRVADKGYGADAAVPVQKIAASVETDSSKLVTEVLPAAVGTAARAGAAALAGSLIKRRNAADETEEDIASGMNHSAVDPDDDERELVLQAYYELANSLSDRVEEMYEDLKELDVQTSENTSPIKILVKGYAKSPHAKAAGHQEDATSPALPPTANIPGYPTSAESYMQHSTANPKKWG